MAAKTDEKTIQQMLADPRRQREAFGIIVSQYSEQLYWQVRRIVTDHDDANDVLQNVFMKAWNGLSEFQNKSRISTWLYRIAVNESLDFVRRQKKKISADADISVANRLMADDYFDGSYAQALLQEAVATLPDVQRTVFTMRYFEEKKYSEISDILGTSVGALKTSYHLAVKKISEYVHRHE